MFWIVILILFLVLIRVYKKIKKAGEVGKLKNKDSDGRAVSPKQAFPADVYPESAFPTDNFPYTVTETGKNEAEEQYSSDPFDFFSANDKKKKERAVIHKPAEKLRNSQDPYEELSLIDAYELEGLPVTKGKPEKPHESIYETEISGREDERGKDGKKINGKEMIIYSTILKSKFLI